MTQETVDQILDQTLAMRCQKTVTQLQRRGFEATYCPTLAEARAIIVQASQSATSIGFGGSLSVACMNLTKELAAAGKEILNHGFPNLTMEQRNEIMRRQLTCDLFLTGTNALTTDGVLVNIDGNGNRVAAMFFGPKQVIIVAGRNKLVEGDACDALAHIRSCAAPANAVRLNKKTPCATTGFCADCLCDDSICRVTTIIEQRPARTPIHVLVVNEDLGL